MTDVTTPAPAPAPSPLPPTAAEAKAWSELTRDEQIELFRSYLAHPDCDRVGDTGMADILAQARARVAARRG